MEIVPLYGSAPLSSAAVVIRINPEDLKACHQLVELSKLTITKTIADQQEFDRATRMGRKLKSMLIEIEAAKKQAKRPFLEVIEQIEAAATGLAELVSTEHGEVLKALNVYVAQLEAAKKEAEAKRKQAIQAEQELFTRQIYEARTQQEAQALELAAELALDAAQIGQNKPGRGLVPGGRVNHYFKFELIDLETLLRAGKGNLVRVNIDHYACLDEVRAQTDKNPDAEPVIPGIRITKEISVSVKP